MSFFYLRFGVKISFLLGFQHRSGSSVSAITSLSATLPLAIDLKIFWFIIALLLYPATAILGLSFLDPKDLCPPNQFSKGSWQKYSVSTYSQPDVKEEIG